MEIGQPIRTIIVEPLELPEPLRKVEQPERKEVEEPSKVEVAE